MLPNSPFSVARYCHPRLLFGLFFVLSFQPALGILFADDAIADIRRSLEQLDPHVLPLETRENQRTMLSRQLRARINVANAAITAEWNRIQTRNEWERFRREKLDLLAASLSRQPFVPGKPRVTVTGTVQGERFRIENLVIQPAGRTIITANLYVPDPPRPSMPGILLVHSHHNPKHEGELQDMGMTWARAGCCVLVPDQLGHGERRQHPFHTEADYPGEFQVGRQDYNFRYDMSLQLYLAGESLMGWMVHDLMSCVDLLLDRPGVDARRMIVLGSVAGGGDPAAVVAALDERITCVVPFNFGGPQPETPYPLPPDAETTFNYAGSGSWESTRNLAHSAAGGFLPWVIVGSVAPRYLIHAHEFAWDQERDPAWKRYQRIWAMYGATERLEFAHGHGTLTGTDPPGSHCNNIGVIHRQRIHDAFRRWFGIEVTPDDEYRNRRPREELACLTDKFPLPTPTLRDVLAASVNESLAARRAETALMVPEERRRRLRGVWVRLVGNVEPPQVLPVGEGAPHTSQVGRTLVTRELLETEAGITVPVMTLKYSSEAADGLADRRQAMVVVASEGIGLALERHRELLARELAAGSIVVLAEPRGMGASSPGNDRGQQGSATAHSATLLMLGQTVLGGQLRDLRAVVRHTRSRHGSLNFHVVGGSRVEPLPADAPFNHPRRISGRPRECEPSGGLLAALLAVFEDGVEQVHCQRGLVSFRSALDGPFVQIPHECIVPGLLRETDMVDLIAAIAPCRVDLETLVDAVGRRVPGPVAEIAFDSARQAYRLENASDRLRLTGFEAIVP